MPAGTSYVKRFAGGFLDTPTQTTPIDQQFLNAVEVALLQLLGLAPTVDGQVAQWDAANTRFGPALLLNKNIDPAANIDVTKLNLTGQITNAMIAGAAAIDGSKLAANIPASKLSSFPNTVATYLAGDGTWPFGVKRLADATLGSANNVILDTGVGGVASSHAHLLIHMHGRTAQAATTSVIEMQFNGDTAANYNKTAVARNAAVATWTSWDDGLGSAYVPVCIFAGATALANVAGGGFVFIPHYRDTTFQKNVMGVAFCSVDDTTLGNTSNFNVGGRWRNTAAITQIKIFVAGGSNANIGSRATIYGLG